MTTGTHAHLDGTSIPPRCTAPHALTHIAAAIDELLTADLTLPRDTDIPDLLRTIETQTRRLHTASLAVTSHIGARALAAPAGATSTAALLRQLLPLGAGEAHQRVRLAAATTAGTGLSGADIPPALPVLAAALHTGTVPAGNAATMVSTLGGFPADVPPDVRESVEQFLVEQAAVLDPQTFSNLARRIALMANPDGPHNERDAADKQQFHIGRRRDDGLTRCWGLLDDLTIEALRAALGALCSPAADRIRRVRAVRRRAQALAPDRPAVQPAPPVGRPRQAGLLPDSRGNRVAANDWRTGGAYDSAYGHAIREQRNRVATSRAVAQAMTGGERLGKADDAIQAPIVPAATESRAGRLRDRLFSNTEGGYQVTIEPDGRGGLVVTP